MWTTGVDGLGQNHFFTKSQESGAQQRERELLGIYKLDFQSCTTKENIKICRRDLKLSRGIARLLLLGFPVSLAARLGSVELKTSSFSASLMGGKILPTSSTALSLKGNSYFK